MLLTIFVIDNFIIMAGQTLIAVTQSGRPIICCCNEIIGYFYNLKRMNWDTMLSLRQWLLIIDGYVVSCNLCGKDRQYIQEQLKIYWETERGTEQQE